VDRSVIIGARATDATLMAHVQEVDLGVVLVVRGCDLQALTERGIARRKHCGPRRASTPTVLP
jgi:hypothetical protein